MRDDRSIIFPTLAEKKKKGIYSESNNVANTQFFASEQH